MSEIEAGWYVVELYGHARVAGHLTPSDGPLYRVDVPGEEHPRYYGANAIYGMQRVDETVAVKAAEHNTSTAAQRYAEALANWPRPAIQARSTFADPWELNPAGEFDDDDADAFPVKPT